MKDYIIYLIILGIVIISLFNYRIFSRLFYGIGVFFVAVAHFFKRLNKPGSQRIREDKNNTGQQDISKISGLFM